MQQLMKKIINLVLFVIVGFAQKRRSCVGLPPACDLQRWNLLLKGVKEKSFIKVAAGQKYGISADGHLLRYQPRTSARGGCLERQGGTPTHWVFLQ